MKILLVRTVGVRTVFKMYIAFKWLLGLTLVMWIAMCSIDVFLKKSRETTGEGLHLRPLVLTNNKNRTGPEKKKFNFHTSFIHRLREKQSNMVYLHAIMFLAGALVVAVYKKIIKIYFVTIRELSTVFTSENSKRLQEYSKITAAETHRIAVLVYQSIWELLKTVACKSVIAISAMDWRITQKPKVNHLLLKKIKELGEERKSLTQLLVAAIHENKNLRMQYQLENMAKNRLVLHIENTQKVLKENRSRYVSFQQLYLVTHQENVFLKSRLKKLTKEKDEVSTNLLELLNEIYRSKNNDLKAYCSRFIVKTKENLLNSDVGAEINAFLSRESQSPEIKPPCYESSDEPVNENVESVTPNSYLNCASHTQITDFFGCDSLTPINTEAPKLKGLPGEYVWTVKDKDGLIEKLYEYDCEPDFENGDTIRRIREYSVYFDKDCLLDFSNSSTVVNEKGTSSSGTYGPKASLDFPLTGQRFLTGSEAFQKFMENNKNIVSTSILPVSNTSN